MFGGSDRLRTTAATRPDHTSAPTLSRMDEERDRERTALIALLRVATSERMKWSTVVAEVLEVGSAVAVLDRLAPATLLGDEAVPHIRAARESVDEWEQDGTELVTVLDDRYPAQLREIHQAPPLLFCRGHLLQGDRGVSVVGSRKASSLGLKMATSVATRLVADRFTVIAGLAAGIDTAAHRAALEAEGRTVAVLGTGIRRYFPAENRDLQDRIAGEGLLLSQFYPDAPGSKTTFPMRNATMSGYGIATVVVEAGEQSGARIQARMAVEHGRPVILTDMVVERNEWAKRLVGRPGVFVASSADEVIGHVHTVDQDAMDLLEAFAPSGE